MTFGVSDPYGTGVQLNMFDAPAGAQMSFFPSEAEQIQSIAEAESVTPVSYTHLDVYKRKESPKGFFCENRACSFVLWKNSRFFTAKKKVLTKSLAAALLKNGRAPLKGCYSEKTGKTYDASVLLEDDGQRTGYKMVFDNG